MKTQQRKDDEQAMRYAGFLGHTVFVVEDDPKKELGASRVCVESCDIESAKCHAKPGQRIYQRIGKHKYKLLAS